MAKDKHKYDPPKWLKIEGAIAEVFLCILGVYIGVTYGEDFITGFAYSLITVVAGKTLHEWVVERPVRHEWILKHMKEYHPDELVD